ncbi:Hypothetical predicted protein [Podarcis lilfordi]|uniref:Uncharacterized protein n=1 Tax=Podarcis lilfordi TaxID=74358 RepID=A0AA35PM52_9SAUR|nr:Hypothetical predicted protein [Podarcis lilfordi]
MDQKERRQGPQHPEDQRPFPASRIHTLLHAEDHSGTSDPFIYRSCTASDREGGNNPFPSLGHCTSLAQTPLMQTELLEGENSNAPSLPPPPPPVPSFQQGLRKTPFWVGFTCEF